MKHEKLKKTTFYTIIVCIKCDHWGTIDTIKNLIIYKNLLVLPSANNVRFLFCFISLFSIPCYSTRYSKTLVSNKADRNENKIFSRLLKFNFFYFNCKVN